MLFNVKDVTVLYRSKDVKPLPIGLVHSNIPEDVLPVNPFSSYSLKTSAVIRELENIPTTKKIEENIKEDKIEIEPVNYQENKKTLDSNVNEENIQREIDEEPIGKKELREKINQAHEHFYLRGVYERSLLETLEADEIQEDNISKLLKDIEEEASSYKKDEEIDSSLLDYSSYKLMKEENEKRASKIRNTIYDSDDFSTVLSAYVKDLADGISMGAENLEDSIKAIKYLKNEDEDVAIDRIREITNPSNIVKLYEEKEIEQENEGKVDILIETSRGYPITYWVNKDNLDNYTVVGEKNGNPVYSKKRKEINEEKTPEDQAISGNNEEIEEITENIERETEIKNISQPETELDSDSELEPELESERVYSSRFESTLSKIEDFKDESYVPGGMGSWKNGFNLLLGRIKPKAIRERSDMIEILEDIEDYDSGELENAKTYLEDKANREELLTRLYESNNPHKKDYQAKLDAKIQLAEIENTVKDRLKKLS